MRLLAASAVILALAVLVIGERVNLAALKDWLLDHPPAPRLDRRGAFDPSRYADQATWDKYIKKGDRLLCLMAASDRAAGYLEQDPRDPPSAASKWIGDIRNELEMWYWHEAYVEVDWDCDFEAAGLKTAFDGLELNSLPLHDGDGNPIGDNNCWAIHHYDDNSDEDIVNQKYMANGKEYTATGAFYEFATNHPGGLVFAKNIMSPRSGVTFLGSWGRPANPDELPELQYCSDVLWAYWVRDNPNVQNLRVYGAQHVVNGDTVLLVTRAMRDVGKSALEAWPGVEFAYGTEGFRALIGSPIGATAAHMLVAHKADLGVKWITKVNIVKNNPSPRKNRRIGADMHMFFTIEDVPQDDISDPDSPGAVKRSVERVLGGKSDKKDIARVHTVRV
ncbi:hypothetical protein P3342_003555 [Pyrenophora teres f. teres]|uniref:Uncharacterized protein n=2 Tax=Pyrenophora teres f. teres TaxID=97479 RepID=E3RFP9_PYRTT|nr:hypothetical protein PTT_06565 [Pyrenophora teres f. teres 0-1]KAE8850195.1 hypothetical protein PTNB85_00611 [Pyrenophora teres f. teres]KAE8870445.1 hypothetical protein PTNB29_00789 [Pyrenophora teres f. teres]KAK1915742.1 hypothetical protein P3342_003555 [Pyrenophora teres f. teres]CAE7012111.1 hypothetical protein PTTW11_02307 [Pyrenophora teres f. teres]